MPASTPPLCKAARMLGALPTFRMLTSLAGSRLRLRSAIFEAVSEELPGWVMPTFLPLSASALVISGRVYSEKKMVEVGAATYTRSAPWTSAWIACSPSTMICAWPEISAAVGLWPLEMYWRSTSSPFLSKMPWSLATQEGICVALRAMYATVILSLPPAAGVDELPEEDGDWQAVRISPSATSRAERIEEYRVG